MGGLPAFAAVTRAVFPGGGTELFYSGHSSQITATHLPHRVAGLKVAQLLPRPCYCSVAKSCPTLGNLMDGRAPGSPVLHYLLEFAQIHVRGVGVTI